MQRLLLATFLTLACAVTAQADLARPETIDDTLIIMRDEFARDPRVNDTKIDLEQRYISFRLNGGPLQISLPDTIHDTLQDAADDGQRKQALVNFIDFTIGASQSAAPNAQLDLAKILPVIRPKGFGMDLIGDDDSHDGHEDHAEEDEEELSAPVSLPFAADMDVFLVQDNDQVVEFVTVNHLEQLEIGAAELLAIAIQNQQTRDWTIDTAGGDGLYILSLDGDFETSFMLNHSFWQGVDVGLGSIVAVVAAPDLVLFVDGDVEGAVENLRTLVDPTTNEFAVPISTTPLKWRNGVWTPVN